MAINRRSTYVLSLQQNIVYLGVGPRTEESSSIVVKDIFQKKVWKEFDCHVSKDKGGADSPTES